MITLNSQILRENNEIERNFLHFLSLAVWFWLEKTMVWSEILWNGLTIHKNRNRTAKVTNSWVWTPSCLTDSGGKTGSILFILKTSTRRSSFRLGFSFLALCCHSRTEPVRQIDLCHEINSVLVEYSAELSGLAQQSGFSIVGMNLFTKTTDRFGRVTFSY